MTRYYITKHVLTHGLIVVDADPLYGLGLAEGKQFVEYQRPRSPFPTKYEIGKDAYENDRHALVDMRDRVAKELAKARAKVVLLEQLAESLTELR